MRLRLAEIEKSPEHMAIYKLMIAGVGFLRDGKYQFFSHEGDEIGEAPAYRVEPFVCFMRRRIGVEPDKYPLGQHDFRRPLTYGWQNLVPWETVQEWMNEMWAKPVVLH